MNSLLFLTRLWLTKKFPVSIAIDIYANPCVDIVADVNEVLEGLDDPSADLIDVSNFNEHVEKSSNLLANIVRFLKPNGNCHFVASHLSNPFSFLIEFKGKLV